MADTIHFDLVSPEQMLLSEDVIMVTLPGTEGYFGVLAGHAPVISTLRPGVIEVQGGESGDLRLFVRGGQATTRLHGDGERPLDRDWAAGQDTVEGLAFVVRHGDKDLSRQRFIDFEDGADVWVVQQSRGLRFFEQPCPHGSIREGTKKLQRGAASEPEICAAIHLSHAAVAKQLMNLVMGNLVACPRNPRHDKVLPGKGAALTEMHSREWNHATA